VYVIVLRSVIANSIRRFLHIERVGYYLMEENMYQMMTRMNTETTAITADTTTTPITGTRVRMTKEIARPMLSALSAVLKMAREERGLSQMEVARRSGLHRTYVCEVERGTRNPSLQSVIQIAAALDVTVSDLITRAEHLMRGEDANRNGEGH
jgi:DNA-binding XRE family transcriptional regulator